MTPSLEWLGVLGAMALLPFLLVVLSSFVKVLVVLGILRNALGIPGVPPAVVLMGVALLLTGFIMAPVAMAMVGEAERALAEVRAAPGEPDVPPDPANPVAPDAPGEPDDAGDPVQPLEPGEAAMPSLQGLSWEQLTAVAGAAVEPLRGFLGRHAHPAETELFVDLSRRGDTVEPLAPDDLMVLAPAFVISELKEAFQIGFLIFLPFLILDLIVANILLGLGMHMLSPTAVSLPFKLLLFVVVDGWALVVGGLISSYQGTT